MFQWFLISVHVYRMHSNKILSLSRTMLTCTNTALYDRAASAIFTRFEVQHIDGSFHHVYKAQSTKNQEYLLAHTVYVAHTCIYISITFVNRSDSFSLNHKKLNKIT